MNTESAPVLFIGIDGGEPALIHRWIEEDILPNLARLYRNGLSGDVRTLPGMGDGATWPTLITGVNPARHGRYFRIQTPRGSYQPRLFETDRDLAAHPFWNALSDAGRRVAILDLPYAPGTESINGTLLTDWLIHDRYGSPRSFPSGFAAEVIRKYGDDPVNGNSDIIGKSAERLKWLHDQLIRRVEMKERMVADVIAKGPWNFIATSFTEPHDLGHVAWHLHDPGDRRHDSSWAERFGDPLKNLYIAIDEAIGRLVAGAGQSATVVVFAGLGMGPNYTANGLMDRILVRLEGKEHLRRSQIAKSLIKAKWPRILIKTARKIDRILTQRRYAGRRYFNLTHNENSGAIRVNLQGRELRGIVKPEELDAVCRELTDAFMELRDPVTHIPIVKEVVRVTDQPEYTGPMLDILPDLFVVWNREAPFDGVESARIGRIDGARSWGRTGDHTPNAMIIAQGPGLPPGRLQSIPQVMDIAPTLAALCGVRLGSTDGSPITEIAEASSR